MKQFKIHFCENKKIYFAISLCLLAVGVIFNIVFGTQLDIEFRGGTEINYSYTGTMDQATVEQAVEDVIGSNVSVRLNSNVQSGNGEPHNQISISVAGSQNISVDTQQQVLESLQKQYPDDTISIEDSSSIDASMGTDFFRKCIVAVIITAVLLIGYIALRFRKIGGMPAGVTAIIALLHDVLMVYFTFVIFQLPVDQNFIAVVLTILGYSLNDTIIVYDRIRENRELMGKRAKSSEVVNLSINQTLTRSIFTALCTFAAIACVFIVGTIFNLSSVTTFALPMMVGIVTGCYSSNCIAGPLYAMWVDRKAQPQNGGKKEASKKELPAQ